MEMKKLAKKYWHTALASALAILFLILWAGAHSELKQDSLKAFDGYYKEAMNAGTEEALNSIRHLLPESVWYEYKGKMAEAGQQYNGWKFSTISLERLKDPRIEYMVELQVAVIQTQEEKLCAKSSEAVDSLQQDQGFKKFCQISLALGALNKATQDLASSIRGKNVEGILLALANANGSKSVIQVLK